MRTVAPTLLPAHPSPFPSSPALIPYPTLSSLKILDLDSWSSSQCPQLNYTPIFPFSLSLPPPKKKSWIWILSKLILESLKLELYDLHFRSYSFLIMIMWIVLSYTVCRWSLGWFLSEILSLSILLTASPPPPPPFAPPPPPQGRGIILWALNNSGFHPVSSNPSLPTTIYRDLNYRMAKMKRILSTLALLTLHSTGLKGILFKFSSKNGKWAYIAPLAVLLLMLCLWFIESYSIINEKCYIETRVW